jgi:hypothetical protein
MDEDRSTDKMDIENFKRIRSGVRLKLYIYIYIYIYIIHVYIYNVSSHYYGLLIMQRLAKGHKAL